jgi:preprotein translocase subunit YajC
MILKSGLVMALDTAPAGGIAAFMAGPGQIVMLVGMMVLFYVLVLMPQQRRAKEHAARISAVKRGDTVVLASGVIGKVVRVEDKEIGLEIAQNVTVKVVKAMVSEVRTRGEPAPANDAKS